MECKNRIFHTYTANIICYCERFFLTFSFVFFVFFCGSSIHTFFWYNRFQFKLAITFDFQRFNWKLLIYVCVFALFVYQVAVSSNKSDFLCTIQTKAMLLMAFIDCSNFKFSVSNNAIKVNTQLMNAIWKGKTKCWRSIKNINICWTCNRRRNKSRNNIILNWFLNLNRLRCQ